MFSLELVGITLELSYTLEKLRVFVRDHDQELPVKGAKNYVSGSLCHPPDRFSGQLTEKVL